MRLTLRTLMAYLDDVLSPADTQDIGQKIQESPMAQLLVSRIKEVMRRRRLKAPEIVGPEMGIDPNIVAQYLDNTLPAEQYPDVERVLLASDELLAETAACHQVLTLILSDVHETADRAKDIFYALGPVEASSQLHVMSDTSLESKSRTPNSISTRTNPGPSPRREERSSPDDERITTLPDYLKPAPWSNQFLPTAMVAGLIIICAALLIPSFLTGVQQANKEIQRKGGQTKTSPVEVAKVEEPRSTAESKTTDSASDKPPVIANVESTTPVPASSSADPNRPEGNVDVPPKPASEVKREEPVDAVTVISPKDDAPSDPAPTSPKSNLLAPEIMAELQVGYVSTDGVMIQFDNLRRHWFVVPRGSAQRPAAFNPGDIVANLEPFDANLEFEKAGIRATLVGESIVTFMLPGETALQGIGVIGRGRILLQAGRTTEVAKRAIAIAIGEDVWKLELQSPETICALEVTGREPNQFMKVNDFHWYVARLYVNSGQATWTNQAGKTQELAAFTELNIIPERVATVRPTPVSIATVPDWCEPSKRKNQALRRYHTQFENTFVADEPVEQTMLTLVQTAKQPLVAKLGALCLSVTNDYAALVETLAVCTHEEARFAARDGLRQWLPMNAEYGPRLKEALERHYSPPDAEAVYRMLWGYLPEDVKGSQATAFQIADYLQSPKLEVRELADFWVEKLTQRGNQFRASAPQPQREAWVARLLEQIRRDNGLIKGP